ncbi:MAG TPA: hypothetical protein EYP30_00090 [Archaeoglobaceae archaeon]|nr:hypothetical protein [Archaeoglobaceae archaeon]
MKPLKAYERRWWDEEQVKRHRINFRKIPSIELPEEELVTLPPAKIIGYLSEELRPRDYDWPSRTSRGLTLLEFKDLDAPIPLITNITRVFTFVSSLSSGLNDLNEIRINYMELEAYPLAEIVLHDLILVLFSISACPSNTQIENLLYIIKSTDVSGNHVKNLSNI